MIASFLLAGWLALNPFGAVPRVPFVSSVSAVPAGSIEPCRIFGTVYFETNPARRGECFGSVYFEPEQAFADVLVFKEDNKLFADKPGFWYLTEGRAFADYVLYVSPTRALADFSITYTTIRSFAGCQRQ